jgi:hypothetical protein
MMQSISRTASLRSIEGGFTNRWGNSHTVGGLSGSGRFGLAMWASYVFAAICGYIGILKRVHEAFAPRCIASPSVSSIASTLDYSHFNQDFGNK